MTSAGRWCDGVLVVLALVSLEPTLIRAQTRGTDAALSAARADVAKGRFPEALAALMRLAQTAPDGEAPLELGLLQQYVGRRADATRTLQAVVARHSGARSARPLTLAARAARALGQFQDANDLFRDAAALAPQDVVVNTAWGELFLEKYNRTEAVTSFKAALSADAGYLPAQLGMARAVADSNPPAARELVQKVLAAQSDHVDALLLLAELDLDDAKRSDAKVSIAKALQANPKSLEAHALDAAVHFVEDRQGAFDAAVKGALAINPRYGDVYRVAGDQAARAYRFEDAVALTRRGLALDDASSRSWAQLGMHLLRTGDEPGARQALERAFTLDPFDVVTFNSLALLDTLDTFVTVSDGDVVLRFHKDEIGVMQALALPLAKKALKDLAALWEFTPKGPILIEMFPKHDDFAVRTLGLPGMIGALGACFGRVVTLDSPKARPPGEFNWGATLWHELAHVMTLQLSNQRIPRWLTEGVSVFEEKRARREWGREQELQFAHALDRGGVAKLKDLNAGFSDPKTISMSYFQASQVVEHIVETYGQPKLKALVQAYATGVDTDAALQSALGITMDQLQTGFDVFVGTRFGSMRRALREVEPSPQKASLEQLKALAGTHPDSYTVQMLLGQTLQKAGDLAGALAAYEAAGKVVPTATGSASPNALIAAVAKERKDASRAVTALEALLAVDGTDIESARSLASMLEPEGDPQRRRAAYQRIADIDPFDADAQTALGRLALQAKDASTAITAFTVVLALAPVDRAGAHTNLGEALMLGGNKVEAKKHALAALELAPQFERAQDLLLKLVE